MDNNEDKGNTRHDDNDNNYHVGTAYNNHDHDNHQNDNHIIDLQSTLLLRGLSACGRATYEATGGQASAGWLPGLSRWSTPLLPLGPR